MDDFDSFGVLSGLCSEFSFEQFNNKFSSQNKKLFVMNFNIRSFSANFDQFSVFLDELVRLPDLITITETWNSADKDAEIYGYDAFHCNRPSNKRGGGVSIYVNKQLKAKSVEISKESTPELEYLHVKLVFNAPNLKPLNVIAIYRPPNSTLLQAFFDRIDSILDSLDCNTNQIFAGDLNICGLTNNSISDQLFDLMRSYSFMPHISRITRNNPHGSSTAIDHIWSNFGFTFESGVFDEIIITDHLINFVILPIYIENTKLKTRFRNLSEQCIQNLSDKIISIYSFHFFLPT